MREVLRRPDFRLLFTGMVASMVGESVLLLALAIWVKDLTGSNSLAGATIFAIVAPITAAPLVGWVVDRFRRRTFLVFANLAAAAVLTPLFFVRSAADLWVIYTVGVFYGLSYVAINGALNGLIQLVVPGPLLAPANGALQTIKQGLRLIGPLAGAALYAGFGGWTLAAVAMLGFVLAGGAVALLRVGEDRPARSERRWLTEVGAGIRHIMEQPALRRTLLGLGLAVLLAGFTESILFAYVDQGLHRSAPFIGVLASVQGAGGLVGGLMAARVVRAVGEIGAAGAGVLLLGAISFTFVYPSLLLGFPATLLAGVAVPVSLVGFITLLQRMTPPELMGRVAAATDMLMGGPQAASIAAGALLVSMVDFRLLFVVMGLGITVAGVYLWTGRALAPPPADAGAPALVSSSPAPTGVA
ncbi:MAG TPA: MFS transporter [Micromonosporaceae bacterium]|nr:MFS transporter [Micromonosporaceae bacterium]